MSLQYLYYDVDLKYKRTGLKLYELNILTNKLNKEFPLDSHIRNIDFYEILSDVKFYIFYLHVKWFDFYKILSDVKFYVFYYMLNDFFINIKFYRLINVIIRFNLIANFVIQKWNIELSEVLYY